MTIRNRTQSRLARIAIGSLGEYKILSDSINELDFVKSKFFQIIVYNSYIAFFREILAQNPEMQSKLLDILVHMILNNEID